MNYNVFLIIVNRSNVLMEEILKKIKKLKWILEYKEILINFLILLLFGINLYDIIYHSITEGSLNFHQILEAIIISLILTLLILVKFLYKFSIGMLKQDLEKNQNKLNSYKNKYRKAISEIKKGIEEQMDLWQLTNEEKKVAKLLILGYTFKQIAGILNKKEKTIRNQSLSIYKKSGMIGRSDLAGYFLSDFLEIEEEV